MLISHLLFTDDTLFFSPNESNLHYLSFILVLFEALTGLKINLANSVLTLIEEVPNLHQLAQLFNCGVDFLPSTYLGLPLGASYKCKFVWEPVVKKFQRRLAGCKSKLLSKGGRLTLLQSALRSIPIYFMSLFTIRASISCQLEKIIRDFLWSNNEAEMGFHWVKWEDIFHPKREGGLSIRPLQDMNKALKAKWLWRFAKEDSTLWKNMVKLKYGIEAA